MWEAIAYVSSGITLVAFIGALIVHAYKAKIDEKERLISSANQDDRAELVRNALEFFHVETAGLTKQQQFEVALSQIQARGERFKSTIKLVGFLALLAAIVASISIYITAKPIEKKPEITATDKQREELRRLAGDDSVQTLPNDTCFYTQQCEDVFSVTFSPNGNSLLYSDRSGYVGIWNLGEQKIIGGLIGLNSGAVAMEYSPNGEKVLANPIVGQALVWDLRTGLPLFGSPDGNKSFSQAAWSDNFDFVALAPLTGDIQLWSQESGKFSKIGYSVKALAMSPDGGLVASPQFNHEILVYDHSEGIQYSLATNSKQDTTHITFGSNGETLYAMDGKGVLRGWDIIEESMHFQVQSPSRRARQFMLSPSDNLIAVIGDNGGVWLFDTSGNFVHELMFNYREGDQLWSGKPGTPWSIDFSPDGKLVVAGSINGEVVVWDLKSKVVVKTFIGHKTQQVAMVKFSSDGKMIASASFDGMVKIWLVNS